MNDMEWGGVSTPVGTFASLKDLPEGDRQAVLDAIEKAKQAEGLDAVQFTSSLFLSYVADLQREYDAMRGADNQHLDAEALKKAVKSAHDVRDALELLQKERDKVDKLRKDIAGGVGAGSLDLDAARDEVGRRLACLRRASGG